VTSRVGLDDIEYLGVRQLARLASVSPRTIRSWIASVDDPLPVHRIGHGKLLVSHADFSSWMRRRRHTATRVDAVVDDVLRELRCGKEARPRQTARPTSVSRPSA
jgi:Helix-turn-helix domain